jgi:hypothetical protein
MIGFLSYLRKNSQIQRQKEEVIIFSEVILLQRIFQ